MERLSPVILLLALSWCQISAASPPRVAIIGSGIGGSSAAHFLRETVPDVEIVVFEKEQDVGGRMSTIDVAGQTFEAGAAILHPRNQYMRNFTESLGLTSVIDVTESLGVFDGNTYRSLKSGVSWTAMLSDLVNMFWNWGLDFVRMGREVDTLLDNFDNFYRVQNEGRYFSTLEDLLDSATPDQTFQKMFRSDAASFLQEKWGITKPTYDSVVGAFSHVNYNQDIEGMNAFVMAVSLAGVQDGLWAVQGGNKEVCTGLLQRAKVELRHDKVSSVKRSERKDLVQYSVKTVSGQDDTFDVVIIATPLKYAGIVIDGLTSEISLKEEGEYCHTYVTFVVGQPSASYFRLNNPESAQFPDMVITSTSSNIPISTLGLQTSTVDGEAVANRSVWKMFSRSPLDDHTLDQLFAEHHQVVVWEAEAFPLYSTQASHTTSFVLDSSLFYTSPIEWAASAMEMSALSGRNAALLAKSVLRKRCSSTSASGMLQNSDSCPVEGG